MPKARKKSPSALTQVVELPLAQIEVDLATQQRCGLNEDTVSAYAEDMLLGHVFPPLVVFRDQQTDRLSSGFHRLAACKRIGRAKFSCEVREGTRDEAIFYAATANVRHGLPRTKEDKRKAVNTVLQLKPEWSNNHIAREVKVSPTTVANVRRELPDEITPLLTNHVASERKFVNRYGKESVMNVSRIGRSQSSAADDDDAGRAEDEKAEAQPAPQSSGMGPQERWDACLTGFGHMVERVPFDAYDDLPPALRDKVWEGMNDLAYCLRATVEMLTRPTEAADLRKGA